MENKPENFIEQIIQGDLASGFDSKDLRFRFPPEPNGHLHIGHAKAIGLNFGLGQNIMHLLILDLTIQTLKKKKLNM